VVAKPSFDEKRDGIPLMGLLLSFELVTVVLKIVVAKGVFFGRDEIRVRLLALLELLASELWHS
jgi:hypothetical protein